MKPILKEEGLEKQLAEQGYVVIPFLSDDEVRRLRAFYYEHHQASLDGMYATAHNPDIAKRMQMNDVIKETFARAIADTFDNVNALGGSFIAKGKGQTGTLKPHQDWNIVDEDHFRSFNVWVPLVDLKDDNGVICVMPKSHLWIKTYRSANIGSVYQSVEKELWDRMSRLYMKVGEALIYDHRLIHASGENQTDEVRLATVFGVIPQGTDMFYYHQKDENTIEVYESNKEFFLYENIFEGPKKLNKVKELPYRSQNISLHQFKNLEKGKPSGILDRLRIFLHLV